MEQILISLGAIFIGSIIFGIVKQSSEVISNSQKPVQTIRAKVAAKRTLVSSEDPLLISNPSATTSYYVTFEYKEEGSRREFSVSDREYGMMAEGDQGTLRHQGTSFKEFQRDISPER
jgi:hypothetical protein